MLRSTQTKNYYIYHMVYGRGSLKKNQIREFHFSKDNNNSLRPESTCIYLPWNTISCQIKFGHCILYTVIFEHITDIHIF